MTTPTHTLRILGILALLILGGAGVYLATQKTGDTHLTTQNIRREIFKNEYFTRLIASGATTEKELEAVAEAAAYGSGFIGVSGEKWSFKEARDLAQRTGASLLDVAVVARDSRKALGQWLAGTFPSTTGTTVWLCEGQEPRLMDCPDLLSTSAPYRPHRVLLVWPRLADWQNHGWSWTIQPQFDEVKPFSEWGLAAVRKGKLWGFVDESGKLVQEPQFDLVWPFSEHGCAKVRVTTAEGNQLWGLVNSKGELVAKPEWGEVQDQINGFTPVKEATSVLRSAGAQDPKLAKKGEPFVNSLGMKFVPVTITGQSKTQPVLFCIWETRVKDYETFVLETNRRWTRPKYAQTPEHPATCLSLVDAKAFCEWLTSKELAAGVLAAGSAYRVPTDHEWSCAAGLGDLENPALNPGQKDSKLPGIYPWGNTWPPPVDFGNYSGDEVRGAELVEKQLLIPGYRDAYAATAPVGSFPENVFGLHDLGGNVREWCEYNPGLADKRSLLRGASFVFSRDYELLSSYRSFRPETDIGLDLGFGFRCVLDVSASQGKPPGMITTTSGKWGYLDASGKLAIPCEWDDAWRFSPEGYAVVTRQQKRGIIDRAGKVIVKPEWDGAINFCQEGLGMMRRGGSWALFHQSGRQITPPEIRLDWNRLAWKDRRWDLGVLPGVGEVWSPDGKSSSDERAMAILQTSALLSQRNKFSYRLEMQTTRDGTGFLNAMGEWKYPPQRGRARPFHQGRAAIEKDGKWGFIDVTAKLVVKQEWDEVKDFSGGYAAVLRGGKWGFIKEDGSIAVEPAWQMCGNAREAMAAVSQNNRWGHVNLSTGQLTVPTQWDEVQPFHEGRAAVRLGQKWGFVDTAGKVIAAPQWQKVSDFTDELAAVRVEPPAGMRDTGRYSLWQFISPSGKPALAGKTVKTYGNDPPTRRNGFISALNANYEWAMFDAEGREQPHLWWQRPWPLAVGLMLTQPERRGGYLDRHGDASISTDLVTTAGGMVMPQVSSRADLMSDFIPHATPPKYGLMDMTGKVLVPPTWDEAEVVSPDWVWFRLGGKCGLADKTGRIHIQPVWDELEVLPVRSGGLAEDGKSILIGWESGTPILSPWVKVKLAGQTSILRLSDAKPVFPGTLTNAEFVDFHGSKHLVIRQPDTTAGVIYSLFDPQTGMQTRFPDAARLIWNWNTAAFGLLWQQHRTTQRWHLMREDGSDTGHTQPDLEKPYGWGFIEARGRLHGPEGWFFIGPDGKPITPEKWEDARDFSGGLAAVMRGQKWGFIGLDGRLVTELIYDEVRDVSRGLVAVRQADRWGYLDVSGKPAIPFIWDAAESFFTWKGEPEGNVTPELDVAVVTFNHSQALIDREGRLIIDPGQSMLKREGAAFVNGTEQLIVMQKAGKADVVVRKWPPESERYGNTGRPLEVSPARRWHVEDEAMKKLAEMEAQISVKGSGYTWSNYSDAVQNVVWSLVDENGAALTQGSGFTKPKSSKKADTFAPDLLFSRKAELNGLIRKDGSEVLEPKYEGIAWVAPGIAAVWNREEGGLFSADGRWLFKDNASTRIARFGSASSRARQHRHGLVVIEDAPKWGYARLNREAPAPKAP